MKTKHKLAPWPEALAAERLPKFVAHIDGQWWQSDGSTVALRGERKPHGAHVLIEQRFIDAWESAIVNGPWRPSRAHEPPQIWRTIARVVTIGARAFDSSRIEHIRDWYGKVEWWCGDVGGAPLTYAYAGGELVAIVCATTLTPRLESRLA